ncbi:MAG: S8 family serine peptidase [Planctomycetota bacterium]
MHTRAFAHGGRARGRCLVALAAGITIASLTAAAGAQVRWRAVDERFDRPMEAEQLATTLNRDAARSNRSRIVVQFDRPLTGAERSELSTSGIDLLGYLGDHAYFAKVTGDASRAVEVAPFTQAVEVQRDWKLHRDFADGLIHPWTVLDDKTREALNADNRTLVSANGHREAEVVVYVMLHKDVDAKQLMGDVTRDAGGRILSTMYGANSAVVGLRYADIERLADDDRVMYVEPALPAFSTLNAENRELVQANDAQDAPWGLDGSGVMVMVYDGGRIRFSHNDYGGRAISGADTDTTSDHATHVAGTIGGDGASSGGVERGMAPAVDIVSYGFETGGPLMAGFLYTDPGDIEQDYTDAIMNHGAAIANNSIGTNTAPNGFPCSWEGDYGITSGVIDNIVRGGLTGSPMRIVWANGNERGGFASCGSLYQTTAPPACAKNHVTVGALNSDTDLTTSFSSYGPADDDRMKPDISAPGCEQGGDGTVRSLSSSSDSAYTGKCGTSMSAPTVTGMGALLLQHYRETYPDRDDFRNSTLKTLLAHTAVDIHEPGPDYKSGYGSVRTIPALEVISAENFAEESVSQGQTYAGVVVVSPGASEMKVTIAWDDVPASPNVIPSLVNDLDLVVHSPSGVRAYPWTLGGLANPGADAVRTTENRVDNIEQVFVENPEPGAWTIEVVGFNVPEGPQPFSIVVTPLLVNCSDAGIVAFNNSEFACGGEVEIRVSDCGLNTDDTMIETVDVTVTSTANPSGITVTLTESAAETADFRGTITLGSDIAATDGDTISVTYNDADDGSGSPATATAQATLDCVAPQVLSASAIDVMPREATIEITTDEPSSIDLFYATSCTPSMSVSSNGRSTSHQVTLTGLADNTTYNFQINSTDAAGNTASDDNGGQCYQFSTPEVPDFFTEEFDTEFDLSGRQLVFTPASSVDGFTLCVEEASALPVDPAGHDVISPTSGSADDGFTAITLTDGATFPFYGNSYSQLFVGTNGYVTFDAGDTRYNETYAVHFENVRIAGLFDDLRQNSDGNITFAQLADRAVATWNEVPEYFNTGANTFQIEMFFDGTIRITQLIITANDAIVGLSNGLGTDPEFLANDLSEGVNCQAGTCTGDADGSGSVETADITFVVSNLGAGAPGAVGTPGDVDGNGVTQTADITFVVSNLGLDCSGK